MFLGWLGEQRITAAPAADLATGSCCIACTPCTPDRAKLAAHPRLFQLAVLMGLASLALAAVSLVGSPIAQLVTALGTSLAICGLSTAVLPRAIAKVNIYMFLQDALYVQIFGAVSYFYTCDKMCMPGNSAPHL